MRGAPDALWCYAGSTPEQWALWSVLQLKPYVAANTPLAPKE
jgi:hypothetical protein